MGGIYTVLNDSQAGMFRLKQASRWADPDEKRNRLSDKAKDAALTFSLDPEFVRSSNAAITAMEEARKIAAPKAMAEQRLQEVEQRIKELRQEARLAAARGDREKLAQLAREAAQLARKAGKAAAEFSVGVSNAAAMGKGAGTEITTTIRQSQTSVTVAQTEVVVQVTLSGDAAAALAGQLPAKTAPAPAVASEAALPDDMAAAAPDEIAALAGDALDFLESGALDGPAANAAPAMAARMVEDNRLRLSRWKEADEFGRRVESVLHEAKSVIGEAKRANETDEDYDRRRERRKELDEHDKAIGDAQDAVNDLRSAAFGTSVTPEVVADAITAPSTVATPTAAPAILVTPLDMTA